MANINDYGAKSSLIKKSWQPIALGALIVLLTVLAYLPALRCGFIWDDDSHVTQNLMLRSLDGLWRIWFEVGAVPQYYPLVHTMFWVEYHLWGLNPLGFHLDNVLLHAFAAILLWRVLLKLQVPGAWLAASIWALHPVQVESVAWITERKNVLSTVFYFASALTYLRFAQKPEARSQKPEGGGRKAGSRSLTSDLRPLTSGLYWLSMFFFVCALLSKTVACSLPAALLLVCWWKKGRIVWRDVWPLLPFFVVGIALGMLTAHIEKTHVGAQGAEWSLTFVQRCLIAGRALWFYAGKLVWPSNLTFIYPRWEVSAAMGWQWIFPIAVLVVIATLWLLRNRIGRGPLVAVLFFSGTLFPALGFINVYPMRYSFVADHFQYLAAVGLMTLAVVWLNRLPRMVWLLPLAACGLLTWRQTQVYRNPEILWRDTLAKNPNSWIAHNNLGEFLCGQGEWTEAEAEYHEAVRLKPDFPEALNNLGYIRFIQGYGDEAMDFYRQALQAEPKFPEALNNLGYALFRQGRVDEGVADFHEALRLNPNNGDAHNNLGIVLITKGRMDEAIAQFLLAIRLKPDDISFHNNLGKALAMQHNYAGAIQQYTEVLELSPNDAEAHYNLGLQLGSIGETEEAIAQDRLALRFKPDYAEAHNDLGVALLLSGKFTEALPHLTEALRLKPDYAEAHNNYAYALIQLGRRDEAIQHLREALRLQPDYSQAKEQLRALGVNVP